MCSVHLSCVSSKALANLSRLKGVSLLDVQVELVVVSIRTS